jgi:taurine dioxygenase
MMLRVYPSPMTSTFQPRPQSRPEPARIDRPVHYDAITVTPESPHIGAEIGGIDLTRPLSDAQIEQLRAAFLQYQVIFFREQHISFDDQIRLAEYFGALGTHAGKATISKPTENPLVRKFHYDENSQVISGENFHSDQSCAPIPPLGTILYNHTVPPNGGGDTQFANMYAAYDALSPRMKTYLDGLTATHDGTRIFGPGTPVSVHPVVVRHPESGRKALYVNTDFTSHINDLPRLEADRLLTFLIDHCVNSQWTVRFRWRAHSIAFWDNRCVQHQAIWDYWPNVRSGFRVQIEGTVAPVAG